MFPPVVLVRVAGLPFGRTAQVPLPPNVLPVAASDWPEARIVSLLVALSNWPLTLPDTLFLHTGEEPVTEMSHEIPDRLTGVIPPDVTPVTLKVLSPQLTVALSPPMITHETPPGAGKSGWKSVEIVSGSVPVAPARVAVAAAVVHPTVRELKVNNTPEVAVPLAPPPLVIVAVAAPADAVATSDVTAQQARATFIRASMIARPYAGQHRSTRAKCHPSIVQKRQTTGTQKIAMSRNSRVQGAPKRQ
jgi:hypothetical protein